MRLIDADAIPYERDFEINEEGNLITLSHVGKVCIDNLPTIDPVSHGHWSAEYRDGLGNRRRRCSNCHGADFGNFPFCHWCGARMDEVSK